MIEAVCISINSNSFRSEQGIFRWTDVSGLRYDVGYCCYYRFGCRAGCVECGQRVSLGDLWADFCSPGVEEVCVVLDCDGVVRARVDRDREECGVSFG